MRKEYGKTLGCAALLFAVNALITQWLFRTAYTNQMGSIEAAFIGIARYVSRHWSDLSWFPIWYGGIPYPDSYPPLLHWVYPPRMLQAAAAAPPEERTKIFSILIPVADPKSGGLLVQVADAISGPGSTDRKIFALHLRRPPDRAEFRTGLRESRQTSAEALRPLLHLPFVQRLEIDVLLGGLGAEARGRHFLGGASLGKELQHLPLPRRQSLRLGVTRLVGLKDLAGDHLE